MYMYILFRLTCNYFLLIKLKRILTADTALVLLLLWLRGEEGDIGELLPDDVAWCSETNRQVNFNRYQPY